MDNKSPEIGITVRIRGTPATLAAEVAGRTGVVLEKRIAPDVNVEVFGNASAEGEILQVFFQEQNEIAWFTPSLLDVVSAAPPIDVAGATGEAVRRDEVRRPREQVTESRLVRLLDRIKRFFTRKAGRVSDDELPTSASIKT